MSINLGLESKPQFGSQVSVPKTHTFIGGITRSGKSVTARKILKQIGRTLIIDCKTPRDYEGVGVEIPLFIEDQSDPLIIKRLLESSSKLWLRKEFPELIDLCKEGTTWEGVLEAAKRKYEWTDPKTSRGVHPVVKERLNTLIYLLDKLIKEMKTINFSKELTFPAEICVMDVHKLSLGLQQIIVRSVLSKILKDFTDQNALVDEGHRFAPEGKPSAAKDIVALFIQEGAAKRNLLYLSDQTITGIDKEVLKQMHVWCLGCQSEKNEADRTLDQCTQDLGLKRRDVYQLKVGFFLVNTREWTKLTYIIPDGMGEELAFRVLRGEIKPEEAFSQLSEDTNLDYKRAWQEEKIKREALEKLETERQETFMKTMAEVEEIKNNLAKEKAIFQTERDAIKKIREGLATLFPQPLQVATATSTPPAEIAVTETKPVIRLGEAKPIVKIDDKTWEGRVLVLIKKGIFEKESSRSKVQDRLDEVYGERGRPQNIDTALVALVGKRILTRRKDKTNTWVYSVTEDGVNRITS